ncbi:MAG TPA: phosphoribosyltransferase family protein [Mycobacteriales bacterium]|nr:phosphoribosyltransferase family protein [Mycobacteriales bacterium]
MYVDRSDAGRVLAAALADVLADTGGAEGGPPRAGLAVLALPRGGVPVAAEVARVLDAPLDVFMVRKLGVPGRPELAMGAIATGGVRVCNEDVLRSYAVSGDQLEAVAARETAELARRERLYRGDRAPLDVTGRAVVVVDDGLATGATMRAAVAALRARGPRRIVVAVPVAARESIAALRAEGVEVVCPLVPERFLAVGQFYDDFAPTSDAEVRAALDAPAAGDGGGEVG